MKNPKAILVDDEIHCLKTLEWQLKQYCPSVQVVASYSSSKEALAGIPTLEPDLVFMDIEMPHMNAFELLNALPKKNFHLIFTTAYNEYALKAFRFSALDYLLKPIEKDELIGAVHKVEKREFPPPVQEQFRMFLDHFNISSQEDVKISLPTIDGYEFVWLKNVIRCQSDSNYTHVYLVSGAHMVVCRTLKFIEETLQDYSFFRVHYSHLVNLRHVQKYIRGDGGTLIMSDRSEVNVARSRKDALLLAFQNLTTIKSKDI